MKVANVYLDSEIKDAQFGQPPQHMWQRNYAWYVERTLIRPDQLVYATRPPFHHMRVLRWHLRTVMRHAGKWATGTRWIPPMTANNPTGDHWWFRGSFINRISKGARKVLNSSEGWLRHSKAMNGRAHELMCYRGFRLDAPMLVIPAPPHSAYRGRVVGVPAASLKEQANHHLRRMAAEYTYYLGNRVPITPALISPWRVRTY